MLGAGAVFERLSSMIEIDKGEKSRLMPFCETAAAVIGAKTRADADKSDVRLLTAAAALAYGRYMLLRGASDGNIESFKAGDVTVSYGNSSAGQSIDSFVKAALADAADLFSDDDFVFGVL